MSEYQLYLGDCLEVMKQLPDACIDMVLADLPYGTTQCAWDVIIPFEPLWREYLRIAKPEAAIVLCAAQPFASMVVASNPKHYRYEWIWEKGNATGFLNAKKQPLRAHESAPVFDRQPPGHPPQLSSGPARTPPTRKTVNSECYGKALALTEYDSTERYPRSVQFFSSDKQTGSFHPTQKPVAWMKFLISTYTGPGHVVLDNSMGSGTTGVACMQLGRRFIGIEKDLDEQGNRLGYLDIAHQRITDAITERDTPVSQIDLFATA
jgi:hypothetical protein